MHRSHLPAKQWFMGAELLINALKSTVRDWGVFNHEMAKQLDVAYEAGWRMKKKLLADLSAGGVGLIREAVCVNKLLLPGDLQAGTVAHLRWLADQPRPSASGPSEQ